MGVDSWPDVRGRLGHVALWGRRLGIRGLGASGPYLVLARRHGGGPRVRPKRSLFFRRRARSLRLCGGRSSRHRAPSWRCRIPYPAVRALIAAWRLALGHAFRRRRPASLVAAHFVVRGGSRVRRFEPRPSAGSSLLAADYGGRLRSARSTAWRSTRRSDFSVDASLRQCRWVRGSDIRGARAGLRAGGAFALWRSSRRWFRGQRRVRPAFALLFGVSLHFLCGAPRRGPQLWRSARRGRARRCLS